MGIRLKTQNRPSIKCPKTGSVAAEAYLMYGTVASWCRRMAWALLLDDLWSVNCLEVEGEGRGLLDAGI